MLCHVVHINVCPWQAMATGLIQDILMITLNIKAVMTARSVQWGRRVTLTEVANATGISRMTLTRMMRQTEYSTGIHQLDKLCQFFQCELTELVSYFPASPSSVTSFTGDMAAAGMR